MASLLGMHRNALFAFETLAAGAACDGKGRRVRIIVLRLQLRDKVLARVCEPRLRHGEGCGATLGWRVGRWKLDQHVIVAGLA